MVHTKGLHVDGTAIDTAARLQWSRTGYTFFPYAVNYCGQWWVLRLNHGFPEHDIYTVFIDARPAGDITANTGDPSPLVASVVSLKPFDRVAAEPELDTETAAAVVQAVSRYVNYGSERDDPCLLCSQDYDPMTRISCI
jgi:hypothetical protein